MSDIRKSISDISLQEFKMFVIDRLVKKWKGNLPALDFEETADSFIVKNKVANVRVQKLDMTKGYEEAQCNRAADAFIIAMNQFICELTGEFGAENLIKLYRDHAKEFKALALGGDDE